MICDSHYHSYGDLNLLDSIAYYEDNMAREKVCKAAVLSLHHDGDRDDILADLKTLWIKYKMQPNIYASMSLWHYFDHRDTADGYLNQLEQGLEQGFDGIKMLEGKPDFRKRLGRRLDDPIFDKLYQKIEALSIPVTMHANDPAAFWKTRDYEKYGWYYGGEGFRTKEEIYAEVDGILKKFPKIRLILAHFYFLSEELDRAAHFLDSHPNVSLDLTPGGEMFVDFSKNISKASAFFETYQNRLLFGSDLTNSNKLNYHTKRYALINQALGGGADFEILNLKVKPLHLSDGALQKIKYQNFIDCYGETPKPLNKAAIQNELLAIDRKMLDEQQAEDYAILCSDFGV